MAIYHFNIQNISINKGKTAIAAASYRSGEKLYSEKQGKYYNYVKEVSPETFMLKPEYAPEWCLNREKLWNEVERIEASKNSRYAKEFNVALPIELSNEEQGKLIRDYCQETFVNDGMVVDIAIHRNDKNNPHAHVMLTNRPFNSDGTWGKKSRIEYILDESGNKTYTKNGNVRKKKIPTTNWDKEETLVYWRHEWANFVNLTLERKGFTEKISAESYETQNIDKTATIHEGVGYRNKDRKQHNNEIKQQEKIKDKLTDINDRINVYKRFDLLTKNMENKDRERIKELSQSLKTFVNFQNLEDKKRMLNNWSTSTYVKRHFGIDVTKTFQTIRKQDKDIMEADKIILNMSKKLLSKEYPFIAQDELMDYEIKWIADKTIRHGIFTQEEIEEEIRDLRPHLLEKQVILITKQPFTSWVNLENNENIAKDKITTILKRYGRDIHNYQEIKDKTPEEFYKGDFKRLGYLFKDLSRATTLKKIVSAHYDEVLSKVFPKAALKEIPIVEKEGIYNLVMYYNPKNNVMTLDDFMKLSEQGKFTSEEKKAGINYVLSNDICELKGNKELQRIMENEALKNLFFAECKEDNSLDPKLVAKAEEKSVSGEENKKQYMENEDRSLSYPVRKVVSIYKHIDLLLNVGGILYPDMNEAELYKRRARNRKLAQLEWSMTRKSRTPHL